MTEQILLLLLLVAGIFIILVHNLKFMIVGMGVLSLIATLCYLYYRAPDVAIAEGIIGCTITTILFIVAFKKHRTFYVYITTQSKAQMNKLRRDKHTQELVSQIFRYCRANELQLQCMYSSTSPEIIEKEHVCDLILQHKDGEFHAYGIDTEQHATAIYEILNKEEFITFMSIGEKDESTTV